MTTLTYPEFTPGIGNEPPYLAGRGNEQEALLKPLARLGEGKGQHRDVIVVGPRGNGKTALMRWFKQQCERDESLDVVWLTPDDIENLDDLANELVPPDILKPDKIRAGIKMIEATWDIGNKSTNLTVLLTARCRERPLVLLIDEAHTLDTKVGRALLNISQKVSNDAPFALVLGGTPGLQYHLNRMDATFWTRSKKLGIGCLDKDGIRDALANPLLEHNISVDEQAMVEVVSDSQGYPFFLQCWGEGLTESLRRREADLGKPLRKIEYDMVDDARPAVEEERIGQYEIAREEIKVAGLQPLAASITNAFAGGDTLEEHRLDAVIQSYLIKQDQPSNDPAVSELRNTLAGFGYVWRPPASNAVWHAGVPSLMKHVLDAELKEQPRRNPG